jgi:hypothetical protein
MYDQLASYLHEMGLSEYESDAYLRYFPTGVISGIESPH